MGLEQQDARLFAINLHKQPTKGNELEADEETGELRPFVSWLAEQRQGATEVELGEALNELNRAVLETTKKGTLTLKITVAAAGDEMVIVSDEIKLSAPEPARSANIFFVDDEANLRRENPRQGKLPLREVEKPANVREIK